MLRVHKTISIHRGLMVTTLPQYQQKNNVTNQFTEENTSSGPHYTTNPKEGVLFYGLDSQGNPFLSYF